MGIEGGWWTFTPETEYVTCPECGEQVKKMLHWTLSVMYVMG